MMKEGDIIYIAELSNRYPKSWIISLEKGQIFSTHVGLIEHDDCIGKHFGETLTLSAGKVVLLKPTPRNLIKRFQLKTQILYPDDCAIACSLAGLTSGHMVGEAGTGSGALTTFIASAVQPDGHVYSFDKNPIHLKVAQKNLQLTELSDIVTFYEKDIIRENITVSKKLNAFFLDFSTPYEAITNVAATLTGGGHLICFVPSWGQVERTVEEIRLNPTLLLQRVFEVNTRNFVVNPPKHVMRPVFRDLVYSGILIHAIKIHTKAEE